MENPRHLGPIVTLCVDRKRTWMVTGGLSGTLSLWDLRFGLLLRTWKIGPTDKQVRVRQCILHPSKGRGRWIIVALEVLGATYNRRDVSVMEIWDIEKVSLVGTYVFRDTSSTGGAPISESESPFSKPEKTTSTGRSAEPTLTAAIAALVRARQSQSQSQDSVVNDSGDASESTANPGELAAALSRASPLVAAMTAGIDFGGHASAPRSFVDLSLDAERQTLASDARGLGSGLKSGFLLVGSEDCSLKLLDLEQYERSSVLSRREDEQEKSTFRYRNLFSILLQEETDVYLVLSSQHAHTSRGWPYNLHAGLKP